MTGWTYLLSARPEGPVEFPGAKPGGWEVVPHGDCTATLQPAGDFGEAGTVLVQCDSGSTCAETVAVETGFSTFTAEASVDGGSTWQGDELVVQGRPGETLDISLKVTMTVTEGVTEGWSYSLAHDDAGLEASVGDLVLLNETIAYTHTETVQGGSLPDFEDTQIRYSGNEDLGFTQGVVIDYDMFDTQDPVSSFVTAGACYRLTFPSQGSYQALVSFTDDLGDGEPPIPTEVARDGGQKNLPQTRSLLLSVNSHSNYTTGSNPCPPGTWISSSDGIPGPALPGGGGAGAGGGGQVAARPVSLGDADNDGTVDLTDAIAVLNHLFRGQPAPPTIDTTRVLRTNQVRCFNYSDVHPDGCSGIDPNEDFFGQDAHYRQGVARRYVVEDDRDGDGQRDAVKDLRTGLMWQRRPEQLNTNSQGGTTFTLAEAAAEADDLTTENYTNWRLPTIGELLSILDYSRATDPNVLVAVPAIFRWITEDPDDDDLVFWSADHLWSTTDYQLDFAGVRQWRINPYAAHTGHSNDGADDKGFAAVRSFKDPLSPIVSGGPEVAPNVERTLGDFDADGNLNLTDAVNTLEFLFRGDAAPAVFTQSPVVPSTIPPSRFVADSPVAGMVEDTHTGLFWMQEPLDFQDAAGCPDLGGLVDWRIALRNAESHQVLGVGADFRLPNVFELSTLTDYAASSTATPALDSAFVAFSNDDCGELANCPGTEVACMSPYWSSTTALDFEFPPHDRAYAFFPNSAVEPIETGVAAGALRYDTTGGGATQDFGPKDLGSWVLPVRGP